jgi:hypothetical protein
MDDWLKIPKDRKRLPVGRLCLIMALTVLLMMSAFARMGKAGPIVESYIDRPV